MPFFLSFAPRAHGSRTRPGASWVPELGRFVTLRLTTRDLRTIDKVGVLAYAKKHGVRIS